MELQLLVLVVVEAVLMLVLPAVLATVDRVVEVLVLARQQVLREPQIRVVVVEVEVCLTLQQSPAAVQVARA